MDAASLVGWIPAIVFPLATLLQLLAVLKSRSAESVSITAWLLFAAANMSLYVYIGKYTELQAILSGLGTALLNIAIVIAALVLRSNGRASRDRADS